MFRLKREDENKPDVSPTRKGRNRLTPSKMPPPPPADWVAKMNQQNQQTPTQRTRHATRAHKETCSDRRCASLSEAELALAAIFFC